MKSSTRRVVDRLDTRLAHLDRLGAAGDQNFVVSQANEAFKKIYSGGLAPDSILIRAGFVARRRRIYVAGDRDASPRPKPPAARLIRSHGLALRLELALLFLSQCNPKWAKVCMPVVARSDDDEDLGLINLFATGNRQREETNYRRPRPAMRARQVEKALAILGEPRLQLVSFSSGLTGRARLEPTLLNRETGVPDAKDVMPYSRPTSGQTISIPIEFFTHGWVQVMTDSEIWNWLVWRHRAGMAESAQTSAKNLRLNAGDRLGWYDLTRDAWDTHQVLGRLGLLIANPGEVISDSTPRGQRFRREPHEFEIDDTEFQTDGYHAMCSAVSATRDDVVERLDSLH